MKLYRLKKDAIVYFDSRYKNSIEPREFWAKLTVSDNALEEVDRVFITYGIETSNGHTSLSDWHCKNNEARLHFTLNAYGIEHDKFNKLTDKENLNNMMNEMQEVVKKFLNDN